MTLVSCYNGIDKEPEMQATREELGTLTMTTSTSVEHTESSSTNALSTTHVRTFKIDYPKVKSATPEVNEIIKKAATEYLSNYYSIPFSIGYPELSAVDIDYETKLDSQSFISVVFSGLSMVDTRPNNLFYAVNICKASAKKLDIDDVVKRDDEFWGILLATAKNDLYYGIYGSILDTYHKDGEIYLEFYLTKNSLGLSFPLIYALGDHAEIEIPYSKLEGLLKIDPTQ